MLDFIRERAHGWLAWIIVGLIIIPFALWGIHQYFGGGAEPSVAKVNGAEISQRDLQSTYLEQRQRLQQMLGANFRPELFSEESMKQRILQDLIERQLLLQTAARMGMRIGDKLLAETIRAMPAFREGSGFSSAAYEDALRARGMQPGSFELQLRSDLLIQQLRSGVMASEFVTAREGADYVRLKQQQRQIGYLLLPAAKYEKGQSVSDEEIAAYYEQHKGQYVDPEMVSVSYLELSAKAIASHIKVSEDQLRARYKAQIDNYRTPEERAVRHILIAVDPKADKAQVAAARKKAEDILNRLHKGESFEKLAKAYSEDPGSAKEGGYLGFFKRGVMDPAFEKSAFSLKKGELSGLVRSDFGFHILRLDDVRGGQTKPFDAVRKQILSEIRTERADEQFYNQADTLSNLVYEHPDSLEAAASELGLEIKKSPFFSRTGGKGLMANPKLVAAAFSDEVLKQGYNSEPVEVGPNHLVALHLLEHKPATQRPLEAVKTAIVASLRREKAQEAAKAAADALVKRLMAGDAPKTLAKEAGARWETQDALKRSDRSVDQAIVRAVFRMARPEKEKTPTVERVSLASGDEAVVALYGVRDGAGEPSKDESSNLRRADANADYDGLLAGLRSRADVTVSPGKI